MTSEPAPLSPRRGTLPSPEGGLPSTPARLPLIAMAAITVLVVLIGVAVGLGGPERLDPGTPEATVQEYLDAMLDGDADAALALLDEPTQDRCARELRDRLWVRSGIGFELRSSEVTGETAFVRVQRRYSDLGDPFGGSPSPIEDRFELRRDEVGGWVITDAGWPEFLPCMTRELP